MNREDPTISPRDFALSIVQTLREAGHIAYFAGGCVRDELFGIAPKDFDVATDAAPQRIAALFPRTEEVGARFGVMIVKGRGQMVEVATFRADGPYSDRRRPDTVTFSDPQTDAARRDFTVNALFLDPLSSSKGQVIDYVNGLVDIKAKVLRAVGDPDERFKEDDLRILRAIRFAARFKLSIDPATSDAIRRHAGQLSGISRERVGEEIRKMLLHDNRVLAARLLAEHGLIGPALGRWMPGAGEGVEAFPTLGAIHSNGVGTLLAALATDLRLSVLPRAMLQQRQRPDTSPQHLAAADLRTALCLSNDETQEFLNAIEGAAAIQTSWHMLSIAHRKRFAQKPWFADALALLNAKDPLLSIAIDAQIAQLEATPGGIAPPPLITGDDLSALGHAPGPRFKAILEQVYDAQLECRISTRLEAVELVRQLCV